MRARILLVAGAVGVGLGMLALFDGPDRASTGTVVVTGSAVRPEQALTPAAQPSVSAAMLPAVAASRQGEEAVVAQQSGAPQNYVYWEGGDAGVWATPAEFSPTR